MKSPTSVIRRFARQMTVAVADPPSGKAHIDAWSSRCRCPSYTPTPIASFCCAIVLTESICHSTVSGCPSSPIKRQGSGLSVSGAPLANRLKKVGSSCEPDISEATFTASPMSAKVNKILRSISGNGCSLSETSVITPSVPNDPRYNLLRSYPATFLTTLPPLLTTVPLDWTTRIPRTRSRALPNRNREGPLAFVAVIPPIVHRSA